MAGEAEAGWQSGQLWTGIPSAAPPQTAPCQLCHCPTDTCSAGQVWGVPVHVFSWFEKSPPSHTSDQRNGMGLAGAAQPLPLAVWGLTHINPPAAALAVGSPVCLSPPQGALPVWEPQAPGHL